MFLWEGTDRTRVCLYVDEVGPDLVLRFAGAGEHVGAVALGDYDAASGRAYVQCLSAPGHRDDLIAREMAIASSRRLKRRVLAFGGIHLESITSEERDQILDNADRLMARLLDSLSPSLDC